MGLTPDVGATLVVALVVALDGAGTRPAPTVSDAPRNPKESKFVKHKLTEINHVQFWDVAAATGGERVTPATCCCQMILTKHRLDC